MSPRKYWRICRNCGQRKSTQDFDRFPSNKTTKPFCRECGPSQRRPSVYGPGPHNVPTPCVQCGRRFTVMGVYSVVSKRKCCSQGCIDAVRRVITRNCRRCKKELPREAFRPQESNSYQVARVCAKCQDDADDFFCTNLAPRPSAYQMHRTVHDRARRAGSPCSLTRKRVEAYYASGCDLCGRAASHLMARKPKQPWSEGNIRKVCRRCNKILKTVSYEELLLCSHEIAACNPLVPGESPYGSQHPRGRAHPKPPKPKLRPAGAVQPAAGPGYRRRDS